MEQEQKFNYGVEITLADPDKFLIIKESLSRLGVKSLKSNTLVQSCHILHKKGKYYIVHFLELFLIDCKKADFSDDDFMRRNTIAKLLAQWGLCKIVNKESVELTVPVSEIGIIAYKEKKDWVLVSKYSVGGRK